MAALAPIHDRLFHQARVEGRREPLEAYGADALVEAVCAKETPEREGNTKKRPAGRMRAKVLVRVDLPALLRGYPVLGET